MLSSILAGMPGRGNVLLILCGLVQLLAAQDKGVQVSGAGSSQRGSEFRVALLVGIDRYPDDSGFSQLQFAHKDAVDLSNALSAQGYKVTTLLNEDTRGSAIFVALDTLLKQIESQSGTIVFAFSGHGAQHNGNQYLATWDTKVRLLDQTGLPLAQIRNLLEGSPGARKVMFIDACRNDSRSRGMGSELEAFDVLQRSTGIRTLNAAGPQAYSYEDPALGHGVFSYFLWKGLSGEAAAGNGLVTFNSLFAYIKTQMAEYGRRTGRGQQPYEAAQDVTGDFFLTGPFAKKAPAATGGPVTSAALASGKELLFARNFSEATKVFLTASAAGNAEAAYWLGMQSQQGLGGDKNPAQALSWYIKAAEGGNPDAMVRAASLYFGATGDAPNPKKAFDWNMKAADAGNTEAMNRLGNYFLADPNQDYSQALAWFRKASEAGDTWSMCRLGRFFENGQGVQADNTQAIAWYRKAADLGNPDGRWALRRLGVPSSTAAKPPDPEPGPKRADCKVNAKQPGVVMPMLFDKVEPEYSEEARGAKFQGLVTVSFVVGVDGRAYDFRVTHSLGLGLDERAIQAMRQWMFLPGLKDGAPVLFCANAETTFRLL